MLYMSERAHIASEKPKYLNKLRIREVLRQLERGKKSLLRDKYLLNAEEKIWVIRIDKRTRLLFKEEKDNIYILDIVDHTGYKP